MWKLIFWGSTSRDLWTAKDAERTASPLTPALSPLRGEGGSLFNIQADVVFLEGHAFGEGELSAGFVVVGEGANLGRASGGEGALGFHDEIRGHVAFPKSDL